MRGWILCIPMVLSGLAIAVPEFVPVQEMAQAQSLTGASLLNDSLYSNPASSAFVKVYSVEGSYLGQKSFAVSVLDTKTSGIGGSVGYFRVEVPYSDEYLQGAKLGFMGTLTPNIGIGVNGKILWGAEVNGTSTNLKDVDFGVLTNLGVLNLGLTLRNLFGGEPTIDQEREWSLGGRINYDQILFFSVATQAKWSNFSLYQYGFGAEYVSPYYFSIKGGYRFQPKNSLSYWSAGLSFLGPKLALHYAVEFPQQKGEDIEHLLAMTMLM